MKYLSTPRSLAIFSTRSLEFAFLLPDQNVIFEKSSKNGVYKGGNPVLLSMTTA